MSKYEKALDKLIVETYRSNRLRFGVEESIRETMFAALGFMLASDPNTTPEKAEAKVREVLGFTAR